MTRPKVLLQVVILPFLVSFSISQLAYAKPNSSTAVLSSTACPLPLSDMVQNSCIVEKNILWRGSRPSVESYQQLFNQGVKTIVNLELEHNELPTLKQALVAHALSVQNQSLSEPTKQLSTRIHYFRIYSSEILPLIAPAIMDRQVIKFMAIMHTYPKPVYVHCRQGQNRTGVVVAAYQIMQGKPIEQAIQEMSAYNGIWKNIDARYLRTFTPEKTQKLQHLLDVQLEKTKATAVLACNTDTCLAK